MKNNKNNRREVMEVKVDMEVLLKGAKVMLKEKQKEVAVRTMVGISKAMPEAKALLRDGLMLFGTKAVKAGFESITGIQSDAVDFVENIVDTGIMANASYNTIVGINNFNEGYKNATNDDINKILKPFYEAAERHKDDKNTEEAEIIEEKELTEEEAVIKSNADVLRNMSDATIVDFMNNFSLMQEEIKRLREELAKVKTENK